MRRPSQPRISRRISVYHERHAPPNKKGNSATPSLDCIPDPTCCRAFRAWPRATRRELAPRRRNRRLLPESADRQPRLRTSRTARSPPEDHRVRRGSGRPAGAQRRFVFLAACTRRNTSRPARQISQNLGDGAAIGGGKSPLEFHRIEGRRLWVSLGTAGGTKISNHMPLVITQLHGLGHTTESLKHIRIDLHACHDCYSKSRPVHQDSLSEGPLASPAKKYTRVHLPASRQRLSGIPHCDHIRHETAFLCMAANGWRTTRQAVLSDRRVP